MFTVYFIVQSFGHWVLFHLTSVFFCISPIIWGFGVCFLSTFVFKYKMHLPLQAISDLSCIFPAPVLDSAISPSNLGFLFCFVLRMILKTKISILDELVDTRMSVPSQLIEQGDYACANQSIYTF